LTGQLLLQFQSVLSASNAVTVPSVSTAGTTTAPVTLPAAPVTTPAQPTNTLIIPSSDSGVISVPAGYQFVIYMGTGQLVGGDASQVVIGDLNYSGNAGTIMGTGTGIGTVSATGANARIAMATGNEVVLALAAAQTMSFDSGYDTVVATGAGDSVSVDAAASVIGYFNNAANFDITGGSSTIVAGVGVNTLSATSGNAVLFGSNAGNSVLGGSGNVGFLNAAGQSTFTAGSGSDTVFAQGGVLYNGSTGNSLFVGGPGMSTVFAAQNETAYGGTGGEVVSLSGTDKLLMVGGGGADTVMGGTVAPTIWGNTNENLTVTNTAAGGQYVLFGDNNKMDLSGSGGGSHIIGVNFQGFTGNTTLVASNAGNDSVVLFSAKEFGATAGPAHTITISNWQSTDLLDLTFTTIQNQTFGYTAADAQGATTALAAGNSFTLSDGTTVVFQGAKPTTVFHA
jgi:hypothetical protein